MGYTTEFEGVLKFKSPLTAEQELFLREMLPGPDECYEDTSDHPDWIKPKGYNGYLQLEIANDKSGIEWDNNEKFYNAVEAVNTVILTMQSKFPNFGLEGHLLAQGEEIGDVWYLKIIDGKAEKIETNIDLHECPECGHQWKVSE